MNGMNIMNMKGEQGGVVLTDADIVADTGVVYSGFTTITATVLTSIACNYTDADTLLIDPISIAAGIFVPGLITAITVTTGTIVLHKASEG